MSRVDLERPTRPFGLEPRHVTLALQIVIALGVSAAICLVIWVRTPDHLQAPLDIVGYSTFHDFDHNPRFVAYRLVVWLFPLLAAAVFWSLRRWWPSPSGRRDQSTSPVELLDHRAPEPVPSTAGRVGRVAALVPAAVVLAVAVSSGPAVLPAHLSARGVLAAVGYLAVVAALIAVVARLRPDHDATPWATATAMVNTVASALAAVAALAYFIRHTAAISTSGSVDRWPWLPIWFFVLAALVLGGALVLRLRRGVGARSLERAVVAAVVGSAAAWMLTAGLPITGGRLAGFDDMMGVTGGDLVTRGYFPWSDFMFIHGFFEDALRNVVGFQLFDHTLWGSNAAGQALWSPLGWTGFYLLAVWAAPRRWPVLLGALALIAWAEHTYPLSERWVAAGFVFILAGEAIRRRQTRWTALMTVALFVEAVLVPEASFQVIAIAVVLVLSDVAHRPVGTPRWRSLQTTRDFVLTGLACTVVWAGYLAANGALKPFVEYYLIFGPGHAASGSLPLGPFYRDLAIRSYVALLLLVIVTFAVALVRAFRRDAVTAPHWLILACAIFAGLYGEKGLARADDAHLYQSVVMTIPLAVLWLVTLLSAADDRWRGRSGWRVTWGRYPASALALVAILVMVPSVLRDGWYAAGDNKAVVADQSLPLVGYVAPSTVDGAQLDDLREVFETLSPDDNAVFDFTNSPGYLYYLLQLDSPTVFYHVSMAIPEFSQELAIDELQKRRPALVAFDSSEFGLPAWDGMRNNVRHFAIAQYLLDGWTPVVRTHGLLVMARNDLLSSLPPLPELRQAPQTRDLYDAVPPCDWGYVPNFLTSKPAGPSTVLDVVARRQAPFVEVSGWTYDVAARAPARQVLLAVGDQVMGSVPQGEARPDVALSQLSMAMGTSGFRGSVLSTASGVPAVYAVLSDGSAHPVGSVTTPVPGALELPGGRRLTTSPVPATGHVDRQVLSQRLVSTVDVPASVDVRSFELASLSARGGLGRTDVVLTDSLTQLHGQEPRISFRTLPLSGTTVSVRVGSCLQWHGYDTRRLYILQTGGRPIDEIRLSDVS